MTQQERDASVRLLRERLAEAKGNRLAAHVELLTCRDVFRALADLLRDVPRDHALLTTVHPIPAIPSSERVTYLLTELREATAAIAHYEDLLRQAGYPV